MNTKLSQSTRWSPLSFDDLRKEMNRIFEHSFEKPDGSRVLAPHANFAETEKEYEITLDLPGLQPEDVNVEFRDGHLCISGERKRVDEEKGKTYHRVERTHGEFRRVIALGNEIDAEKIHAKYENGVLTVVAPKIAAVQPKKIAVSG